MYVYILAYKCNKILIILESLKQQIIFSMQEIDFLFCGILDLILFSISSKFLSFFA